MVSLTGAPFNDAYRDVDWLLTEDYTEDSVIIVYDQTSGGKTVFTGLAGVRDCFTSLFARLSDLSDLAAPVSEVNEAANGQPGSVFLIWRCPASGYAAATDTFTFDNQGKIIMQNVVVQNSPPVVDDQTWCAAQCQAQGHCCNDPNRGSNQMISCARACMMRASGQSTEAMVSANGGICDRCGNSGCSLTVWGKVFHCARAALSCSRIDRMECRATLSATLEQAWFHHLCKCCTSPFHRNR